MEDREKKKLYGKFFTYTNPFNIDIFFKWFNLIPEEKKKKIIEPFAGSNNIVKMIEKLSIFNSWDCFDIFPPKSNAVPKYNIIQMDTIENFPKGYYVAITNPPYLAKNSAKRTKLPFPDTFYDDLYKLALDVMLSNLEYVAAIIPESFINAGLFHNRLFAFVSLPCKMFEDTDCPVCLALFVREEDKKKHRIKKDDFFVYIQNKRIGRYKSFEKHKPCSNLDNKWVFNDKEGPIGIICIDNKNGDSIEFIHGELIPSTNIKISSRASTRISGLPENVDLDVFLKECNNILKEYRKNTYDIFFTSFKGLRVDNKYRRRLDFANARSIMNLALENLKKDDVYASIDS